MLLRRLPRCALALLAALCLALPVAPAAASLEEVGAYDPGTPGLNTSAVGLDGIAYLGSWGGPMACPGHGVRVFDIREPSAPVLLGALAAFPRTTAEHLAVFPMATPTFGGNLLLAGIQRCNASGGDEGGLSLWDVSDPTSPREVAYHGVGRAPRGVHEFAVGRRGDRWYAYLAVPNAEVMEGRGDLRVLDITDPYRPVEVASWGAQAGAGLRAGFGGLCAPSCRGAIPQAFLHSVALSPDQRTAYLSYWDLGVILLDVSEPSAPRYLGRYAEPPAAEGNTHSVALVHEGRLALVADETFSPPWGRLRLVDVQDPANPVQVGTFDTPNSAAGATGLSSVSEVWYTIHNPLADDRDPNRAYLAWYADGVRLVDVSDASAPYEVAAWVPPRNPFVWNVSLMGDLVLVGDVNNGLFILRR